MNGNLRVGTLFGIPFFLNISWFLVLALVTLNYGTGLAAQFPELGNGALLLGLVTSLLLFGSVLLHELGHSFAARNRGIQVNSITLFLFGGLANFEEEAKTPGGAFWIAVAGPLVSLALFLIFTGISISGLVSGATLAIAGLLAYINLILASFNMIPGLPLDGGNVLKSIVWKVTGNPFQGTLWASRVGQLIGWSAIAIGSLSVLGLSNIGSFWTLLIGWFLLQNAGRSAQSATIQQALSGLTAADAVGAESPIIDVNCTLREFADMAHRKADLSEIASKGENKWQRFLVKDSDDQLLGSIRLDALQGIPAEHWSNYHVRTFLKPITPENQVASAQPLLEVINKLEKQGIQALAVIRENGTLLGLLEKSAIINLLETKQQSQPI